VVFAADSLGLVFGKVRAPVKVTVDGYTYRSTVASMGNGPCLLLGHRTLSAGRS
jgi:hypothetical protein